MKRLCVDVGFAQLVCHYFCGVLCRNKDQHAGPFFGLNQLAQQLRAACGIHSNGALRDFWLRFRLGLYLNAKWVLHQVAGQHLHGGRKRRREQSVLPLGWQ